MWAKGSLVTVDDPVGKYLIRRCGFIPDTKDLRTVIAEDGAIMLAVFRAPDDKSATLHLTCLNEQGETVHRAGAAT
jgi:hypothetical protein